MNTQKAEVIGKIKDLLLKSEIAQDKVQFNWNGTKVINPMQQAASNRLYNKAYKLCCELGMDSHDIIAIHRTVISAKKNN